MSLEEENDALRAENVGLRAEIETLTAQLTTLREQAEQLAAALHAAQDRIAELEAKKTPPPAFVKANNPVRPKRPRQSRTMPAAWKRRPGSWSIAWSAAQPVRAA